MTPGERVEYFTKLWPAAAKAKGWAVKDDERRRAVALDCMRQVRGPAVTTSDERFGRDEVTALFTYLLHLGHPDNLIYAANWVTCLDDYRTYNRAKQADWHERQTYGPGKNKLDRDRFAGATSAAGGTFDPTPDAEAVRRRHMTMASRHQKKQRAAAKAAKQAKAAAQPAPMPTAAVIAGDVILAPWHEPAAVLEPEPAYAGPEGDNPF